MQLDAPKPQASSCESPNCEVCCSLEQSLVTPDFEAGNAYAADREEIIGISLCPLADNIAQKVRGTAPDAPFVSSMCLKALSCQQNSWLAEKHSAALASSQDAIFKIHRYEPFNV